MTNVSVDKRKLVWSEYYRPSTIKDIIAPERVKGPLTQAVASGDISNYMFIGVQGSGKTTAALALAKDLGWTYLKINASEEGGINTIRTTARSFAAVRSLDGKPKLIIFDEADGSSAEFQQALRGFMDEFAGACRFILTANYEAKLIPALKSRTTVFDFTVTSAERKQLIMGVAIRIEQMLVENNIPFQRTDIAAVVSKFYPDVRRCINEIQGALTGSGLSVSSMSAGGDAAVKQFVTLISGKEFTKARQWVADSDSVPPNAIVTEMYKRIEDYVEPASHPDFVGILHEYDYRIPFVSDPQIWKISLAVALMTNIKMKTM